MSRLLRRPALLAAAAVISLGACGGDDDTGRDAGGDVTSEVVPTQSGEPNDSVGDEEPSGETTVAGSRVVAPTTTVATTTSLPTTTSRPATTSLPATTVVTTVPDEFELPPISAEDVAAIELALDELDQLLTDIELDLEQD